MDDLSQRPDRVAIARLVERFYADVRADELLAPVFEPLLHDHWPAHRVRMTDFWCTTLRLERSFRGDVHHKHMALAGIRPSHLRRWLRLWQRDTALELNPAAAARLQDVAVGIARVMALGWFGRLPSRDQLLEELALDASAA